MRMLLHCTPSALGRSGDLALAGAARLASRRAGRGLRRVPPGDLALVARRRSSRAGGAPGGRRRRALAVRLRGALRLRSGAGGLRPRRVRALRAAAPVGAAIRQSRGGTTGEPPAHGAGRWVRRLLGTFSGTLTSPVPVFPHATERRASRRGERRLAETPDLRRGRSRRRRARATRSAFSVPRAKLGDRRRLRPLSPPPRPRDRLAPVPGRARRVLAGGARRSCSEILTTRCGAGSGSRRSTPSRAPYGGHGLDVSTVAPPGLFRRDGVAARTPGAAPPRARGRSEDA